MEKTFKEVQRFRQWWLWLILIGLAAVAITGVYKQLIIGEPLGDNPMPDAGLVAFAVFIFIVVFLFGFVRQITTANEKEVRVFMFPFYHILHQWDEVESAEAVHFPASIGWGIRSHADYGIVYNISEKTGVFLKLKNGKKLCIGTRNPEELKAFVRN